MFAIRHMKAFFVWSLLMVIGGIHAFAAPRGGESKDRDRSWVTDKNEEGGFKQIWSLTNYRLLSCLTMYSSRAI